MLESIAPPSNPTFPISRLGKLKRLLFLAIGAVLGGYGLSFLIRHLVREGNGPVVFWWLVASFALCFLTIGILGFLLRRERGVTRALFSQLEAVGELLPRTTFWARRPSGAYQWFLSKDKDPRRVERQIRSVLNKDGPCRAVDVTVNHSGSSVAPGIPENSPLDAFRVEAMCVDIGLGDSLCVGMTHQIDSISDNNPMIRGLLPMVSNRFRVHLYSQDLKTVYVYWTKERWPLGLGVPLDSSTVTDCIHPDDTELALELLQNCISDKKATTATFRWIGHDGRDNMTMVSNISPIYDGMGNFCGVVTLSYDISSDLSDTLEQVRNKISVHIYEQFLTRLPQFAEPVLQQLDVLANRLERNSDFADLVDLENLGRANKSAVGAAVGVQADQLRRDLRDLSGAIGFMSDSAMVENMSTTLASVSLVDVCQDVLDGLHTQIQGHRVSVRLNVEARLSSLTMGLIHRENFTGALSTIVGNSVRFSPEGGEIAITIRDDENDPRGFLIIEVHDDGPGPDGVDYQDIANAHLLASPIQSSVRDDTMMVLSMLMLLKQGVFLSYSALRVSDDAEQAGLRATLRVRRAA